MGKSTTHMANMDLEFWWARDVLVTRPSSETFSLSIATLLRLFSLSGLLQLQEMFAKACAVSRFSST